MGGSGVATPSTATTLVDRSGNGAADHSVRRVRISRHVNSHVSADQGYVIVCAEGPATEARLAVGRILYLNDIGGVARVRETHGVDALGINPWARVIPVAIARIREGTGFIKEDI